MIKLNQEEIKRIIPHRSPFLFIDNIEIIKEGEIGVGYRTFNQNEFYFKGHFPNNPIVPGVIIVEALAQTAGIVAGQPFIKEDRSVLFMSLQSVKFRKPIKPGEKLSLHVSKMNQVKNVYKFSGLAKKDLQIVTEAVFTAMIV